ncbi:MAG: type III-B CRISPR-associated protein Cas10/Cmr2 [Anaerolineales bacterium]|nr:type III-B CRISPR-associated protein Cas10/Cmr2 [Anaerolineales bacterium]
MTHIFICAIGPVQDFIATARRSRDLWYGSWMLSELSKAAACFIAENYGEKSLIFPSPDNISALYPETEVSVANKIVAVLETLPEKFGEKIQEVIATRLDTLQENAFDKIMGQYNKDFAKEQVKDLLEYYWVSVKYDKESDYSHARDQAERLLATRKNTRNFENFQGDYLPKSSLDGARESVIPETAYPQGNRDPQRDEKIRKLVTAQA